MEDPTLRAVAEFEGILAGIDRKFEVIHARWTGDKLFEAKLRTQIARGSDDFNALCDEWVDLFSAVTRTVWVKKISNTGPKIRFRKQYQCWTHGGKTVQKELLFDARRCKGTLDVKVLTDNPFTRRKNKHIKQGLNVVVKINFVHLHPVDTYAPLSFFVHLCDPLEEAPKPVIQPNDRLPQLVAEMVQKGLNASPKILNPNPPSTPRSLALDNCNPNQQQQQNQQQQPSNHLHIVRCNELTCGGNSDNGNTTQSTTASIFDGTNLLHDLNGLGKNPDEHNVLNNGNNQVHLPGLHTTTQTIQCQLVPNVSNLQSLDGGAIKLELAPSMHGESYTQLVVSGDMMSEPLLMCQSLMFDTSQIIPLSATTTHLPQHFVQIHSSPNLHNQ